jgi:hypothetical protein
MMLLRALAAALALLVGGALLWVFTADSNNSDSRERATSLLERKAARIEKQLTKDPNDGTLLPRTMRAWIRAGAEQLEQIDTRTQPIPAAVQEDYEAGLRAWSRYLERTDGAAGRNIGETAAVTYFQLVEIGSPDPSEAAANAAGAVRAERIVCEHDPTLFTLSDLAIYHYFNGESAAGDSAARRAAADVVGAPGITPREVIEELDEYKEQGEKFVARVKRGVETLEETGEEELDHRIKGYGSPAGLNGYEPT